MIPTQKELQCIKIALKHKAPTIIPKDETKYSVTDLKLFSVLWAEHGLKLDKESELSCIKEWVDILFEKQVDIDFLCEQLKQKNEGLYNSFHSLRKGRFAHIELVPPIEMLPEEIDDVYGQYMETDNNYFLVVGKTNK